MPELKKEIPTKHGNSGLNFRLMPESVLQIFQNLVLQIFQNAVGLVQGGVDGKEPVLLP